jgi:hypothetical protein
MSSCSLTLLLSWSTDVCEGRGIGYMFTESDFPLHVEVLAGENLRLGVMESGRKMSLPFFHVTRAVKWFVFVSLHQRSSVWGIFGIVLVHNARAMMVIELLQSNLSCLQ